MLKGLPSHTKVNIDTYVQTNHNIFTLSFVYMHTIHFNAMYTCSMRVQYKDLANGIYKVVDTIIKCICFRSRVWKKIIMYFLNVTSRWVRLCKFHGVNVVAVKQQRGANLWLLFRSIYSHTTTNRFTTVVWLEANFDIFL